MRPGKLVQIQAVNMDDGLRKFIVVLALDSLGRLCQRELPDGEWQKLDR